MFLYLGFLINKKEKTTCLGLIFYSVNMLLSVTDDKKEKIYKSFNSYLEKRVFEVGEISSLILTLTATFP